MENLQKNRFYVIAFTIVAVIHTVASQRHLSNGGSVYTQPYSQQQPPQPSISVEECGVQDKDELPDFHAAAPWAAALFYVDGDLFQKQLNSQYLSTAIFISKRLAITSGSKILTQQQTGIQSKLTLYYGHRASGKQTLIRIRKVEPLNPQPRQPLALKVETTQSSSKSEQIALNVKSQSSNAADLYLLHLESEIDVTPFSRPLCTNENVFQYKNEYFGVERQTNGNKVYLSGYASKNDSNGPHVVYFSQDHEWRVQSWDTDNINVIMREHQVSYGFLPKHFNIGSALTVKMNDQFFLVGILVKTTDSKTVFRSLEKFVETIHIKDLEYAPKPSVAPVSNDRQPKPSYDIRNTGNDRYSEQKPQRQSSNVEEQFSYLQQSEFEEKVQSRPTQVSLSNSNNNYGVASNPNWGTATRTTSKPDYYVPTGPSVLTARPDYPQTPRASQVYHQTPPPMQIPQNGRPSDSNTNTHQGQIYIGGREVYTTSTTQRPYQPSQFPQIARYPEAQPERPSQQQNPERPYQQQQTPERPYQQQQSPERPYQQQQNLERPYQSQQNSERPYQQQLYYPQQQQPQQQQPQYTKCAQQYLEGVEIECISRPRGVSNSDCINNAPANTTIRLSCKQHYIPLNGDKVFEKTCDTSGNWLPRKTFDCKIGCGLVGNSRSVPYIVGGSKTAPEKWPWHAAIFKRVNQTSYTYICGATLISKSILVTAAHCVQEVGGSINKSLYKVVVGAFSSDLSSNQRDPQAQEFDIKGIKINEHYDPRTFEADIALVQINKPVLLSDYVRPVCFPFPTDENKLISSYQLSEGNNGIVVGFGTTSDNWSISKTLRMATLPIVSVKNCTSVLGRQPTSSQYCAGYTNGTSVCEGDSGGAHIFRDQLARYFIQGVISHGNRKDTITGRSRCDNEKYTVFTKVETFAEWVKAAVYDLEFDYNRRRRK